MNTTGINNIFPNGFELIPQLNEIYELQLARMEVDHLNSEELINQGAYFRSINGIETKHFQLCIGDPLPITTAGEKRRMFFANNIFKTGYATHGFFPYRGKFHPQMVKAIINVMSMKPGDVILDPMMGSGTTLIEASTMGIKSVGYDLSPFCMLMTQAKLDGLSITDDEQKSINEMQADYDHMIDEVKAAIPKGIGNLTSPRDRILALAYLDAVGFSNRSSRLDLASAFKEILSKYMMAIRKFQKASSRLNLEIAESSCKTGDARELPLKNDSIDGILFSPPYSFAVDYIENDFTQLKMLNTNINALRSGMIGLRGKKGVEQVLEYIADIKLILAECSRVLKKGKCCTIVIGTNSRQLASLRMHPELKNLEPSLEEMFINLGKTANLQFEAEVRRQITGLMNTMREESILFFRK